MYNLFISFLERGQSVKISPKKTWSMGALLATMAIPTFSLATLNIYEGFNYGAGFNLNGSSGANGGFTVQSFGWDPAGTWVGTPSGAGEMFGSSPPGTSLIPANVTGLDETGNHVGFLGDLTLTSGSNTRNFASTPSGTFWASFVAAFLNQNVGVPFSESVQLGPLSLTYDGTNLTFGGSIVTFPSGLDPTQNVFYAVQWDGTNASLFIPQALNNPGSSIVQVPLSSFPSSLTLSVTISGGTSPFLDSLQFDEFRGGDTYADVSVAPVPEPSTLVIMSVGLFMLLYRRYREKNVGNVFKYRA